MKPLSTETTIRWFNELNLLAQRDPESLPRVLESFWASQLRSKQWLLKHLLDVTEGTTPSAVYVNGGWYGVLAQMISDVVPNTYVTSIDVDPSVIDMGRRLNPHVHFAVAKMQDFAWYTDMPTNSWSINTSSEHMNQYDYDQWLNNHDKSQTIVVQGNNFFECKEHVRCYNRLSDFIKDTGLNAIHFAGELDCKEFTRFMVIGTV